MRVDLKIDTTKSIFRKTNYEVVDVIEKVEKYYRDKFKIDIKNIYVKAKDLPDTIPWINSKFPFVIVIKDNNKKIFKRKKIKAVFNRYVCPKEVNFDIILYQIIDSRVSDYCSQYMGYKSLKHRFL